EVALLLRQRRNSDAGICRARFIFVVFGGEKEKRLVFLDRSAERTCAQVIREVSIERNAGPICEPSVCRTPAWTALNQGAAVQYVRARFSVGVEYATSGTAHLRVERVHLYFDLSNRFDGRRDACAVGNVGDGYAVDRVVVTADRASCERYRRRAALI